MKRIFALLLLPACCFGEELPVTNAEITNYLKKWHSKNVVAFGDLTKKDELPELFAKYFHMVRPPATNEKEEIALIGLLNSEAKAYVEHYPVEARSMNSDGYPIWVPLAGQAEAMRQRPLRAFEKQAVERFMKGETHVIEFEDPNVPRAIVAESLRRKFGQPIYMVAPIRASQSCLSCHKVEENVLLGAFSYRLHVKSVKEDMQREKHNEALIEQHNKESAKRSSSAKSENQK